MEGKREYRAAGGRRYNLDTAKLIGKGAEKTLYRKSTGEFFLHAGDKIEPLIYRDARKWAEKNLTEEEFETAFLYTGAKKAVLYNLPEYAIEKVKRMAADRRIPASQVLTDLIMDADE